MAAALLNYSVYHRKSQARALARLLCCEERFKNAGHRRLVHSVSGIDYPDQDILSRCDPSNLVRRKSRNLQVGGLDRETAAPRHCVTGVYGQIHQHLLNLMRVGFDAPEVVSRDE